MIPAWTGSRYLGRLIHPGQGSVVSLYSSNRFCSGSTVSAVVEAVLHVRSLSGIGVEGVLTAYDDAWVEGLVYAGLFGVVGYTLVMGALARGLTNVVFVAPQPVERMADVLAAADIQLASLEDKPIFRSTLPSKVQSLLAAGRPILGFIAGDAAQIITESGAGLVLNRATPQRSRPGSSS